MHALQFAPWYVQVPGGRGPPGQDEGVKVAAGPHQLVGGDIRAHFGAAAERHPLGAKLGQATLQDPFLQFEVGDAVAQYPSWSPGTLEDGDPVAGPGQLLGGGQAGRSCPHHAHLLTGEGVSPPGDDPALGPGHFGDLFFDYRVGDGSSFMDRVQAASHSSGQSLPVSSGKLLVACRRSEASRHRPR